MRRLALFAGLVLASPAVAQEPPPDPPAPAPERRPADAGGMGGLGGGPGGGMGGPGGPRYAVTWFPDRPVRGQPTRLGLVRQEVSAPVPLWMTPDGDALMGSLRAKNVLIDTDAVLPDTRRPVPDTLWDLGVGLTYMRRFENGWMGGLMVNVGAASDQPFAGLREMNVGGGGFLRVPAARDGDFWNFAIMYSPLGQLPFPVPGVSYQWRASDRLQVNVGVPFSILWRPTDEVAVNVSYMPLTIINARATWTPRAGLSLFGGFEWGNEGYFLAGRDDRQERFLLLEKRLLVGARYAVLDRLNLEVTTGHAFDRSFGTGASPLNSSTDQLRIGSGAFLAAGVSGRF
jgi:hypothetical protein